MICISLERLAVLCHKAVGQYRTGRASDYKVISQSGAHIHQAAKTLVCTHAGLQLGAHHQGVLLQLLGIILVDGQMIDQLRAVAAEAFIDDIIVEGPGRAFAALLCHLLQGILQP